MSTTEIDPGAQQGFGRVPPHDVQAEQIALGGMMLSRNVIPDVSEWIKPDSHYRPAHQMIHEAILALDEAGRPTDAVAVADLLEKRGELARAGGPLTLHDLIAAVPTAANAGYYAQIVYRHAVRRQMIERGTRIVQGAYERDGDPEDMADWARAQTQDIADRDTGNGAVPIGELFLNVVDDLDKEGPRGIPTPWVDVNEAIGGLMAGEMITVAGSTGAGKSLALQGMAAYAAIQHGIPTLLETIEMSDTQVMLRLISSMARVPLQALLLRRMEPEYWDRIERVREQISDSPLIIDYNPGCTVAHIRRKLRDMARTDPAGLVCVDYIGLLSSGSQAENRQAQVAEFSRDLKILAGQFGIPVVAAAQLNRGPDMRGDKRPQLSDVRESAAIGQDSSVVLLLYREDLHNPESPRAGEIDFIVGKNRNGPLCEVTEAFQGHYSRIVDMAPEVREWSPSNHATN